MIDFLVRVLTVAFGGVVIGATAADAYLYWLTATRIERRPLTRREVAYLTVVGLAIPGWVVASWCRWIT